MSLFTPSNFHLTNAKTKKTLFSFSQDFDISAKITRKKESYKDKKTQEGKGFEDGNHKPLQRPIPLPLQETSSLDPHDPHDNNGCFNGERVMM